MSDIYTTKCKECDKEFEYAPNGKEAICDECSYKIASPKLYNSRLKAVCACCYSLLLLWFPFI